jgi:hypothetical protein
MRDEIERARTDIERAHSGEASTESEASKAQKLADLRKRYMELSDAAMRTAAAESERRKNGLKRARGETTASGLEGDEEARSVDEYEEDEEDAESGDELDFTERRRRDTAAREEEEDTAPAPFTAPLDALRPREGAAMEFEEGGDEDAFQEDATGAALHEDATVTALGDDEGAVPLAATSAAFQAEATAATWMGYDEDAFIKQAAAAAEQPSGDARLAELSEGRPSAHEDAEMGTIPAPHSAEMSVVDQSVVGNDVHLPLQAFQGEEAAETAEWNDRDSVAGED